MKRLLAVILMVTLGAVAWDKPTQKASQAEVERLKDKASRMKDEDRAQTYSELCLQLAEAANEEYADGNPQKGVERIKELLDYAQKVLDLAKQKDKKVKQSEINIRKCSRRLEDIQRAVNLEDQPPIEEAVRKLDGIREDLLKVLFRK